MEVYSKTMGSSMKKLIELHRDQVSKNKKIDLEKIRNVKYLHEFDRAVQVPSWGYPTEGAYYRDASSTDSLLASRVPIFAINAKDDPVIIFPFDLILGLTDSLRSLLTKHCLILKSNRPRMLSYAPPLWGAIFLGSNFRGIVDGMPNRYELHSEFYYEKLLANGFKAVNFLNAMAFDVKIDSPASVLDPSIKEEPIRFDPMCRKWQG